tara:strand:+ start:413 stop:871 length:459 start_codon:yes stop_codon:yes gene_type:complete
MYNHKIFYNEVPSLEQEVLIITYLEENNFYHLLKKNHMFVFLSKKPREVFFKLYKSSKIEKLIEISGFSQEDAMDYVFNSFTFFQELREILYWNNIGTYKKYVPCTGEIKTTKGIERVVEKDCVFAKTENEAELLFKDIGYNNLMYVVDIDE